MTQKIVPVIMAGGKGTRLWPLSRASAPKQFIQFIGDQTLFQETLARVSDPALYEAPIVVTNEEFRFLVAEQARELGHDAHRNPARTGCPQHRRRRCRSRHAGRRASSARTRSCRCWLPITRSSRTSAYFDACAQRATPPPSGKLVTFGITPTEPATGYGYIEIGEAACRAARTTVKRFIEKPRSRQGRGDAGGRRLLLELRHVHVLPVELSLAKCSEYAPDVLKAAERGRRPRPARDLDFIRLDAEAFAKSPDISIDYAIMEKTANAAVVPSPFSWSDLGSWDAVWKTGKQRRERQCRRRQHDLVNTRNSLVMTHGVHLAVQGMEDIAVIASEDAVYVGRLKDSQKVGKLVKMLAAPPTTAKLTETHPTSYRPWGGYTSILNGERFQVKRIFVTPGKKLSLQKHHHRSEHWIVVKGTAEVTIGENVQMLRENESVYIPLGEVHRLANPGKILLELIEVQTGSYLGEDDIIRIVDEFGRN